MTQRHFMGSFLDAVLIGVGGSAVYWVLSRPSFIQVVIVAVIAGPSTALLMRYRWASTAGDQLVDWLLRLGRGHNV